MKSTPLACLLFVGAAFGATVQAQSTPAPATPASESAAPDGNTREGYETVVLDPFSVEASVDKEYAAASSAGALLLNTPIREIPQTVNVVTSNFIDVTGATSFADLAVFVPGVTPRQNVYDGAVIRGYITQRSYNDGVRNFDGAYTTDLANFQRIEFIKGPAAAVLGTGEAGGYVNRVSKVPLANARQEAVLTIGSQDFYRFQFDSTGPVTQDKSVLYRVVTAYQNNDTTIPGQNNERTIFAPQASWTPFTNTNLRLQYEYQDVHTPNDFGMPYLAVPSASLAHPALAQFIFPKHVYDGDTFSGNDNLIQNIRGTAVQKINKFLELRIVGEGFIGNVSATRALISNEVAVAGGGTAVTRSYAKALDYIKTFTNQTNLVATYDFFGINFITLGGYELVSNYDDGQVLSGTLPNLNLYAPVYNAKPGNVTTTSNLVTRTNELGYFAQQEIKFFHDRVTLTGGIRYDKAQIKTLNRIAGTNSETTPLQESWVNAPRVGGTVAITTDISLYGIYSSQKSPPTQVREFPNSLSDQTILTSEATSSLKEGGVKADILGQRLYFTGAYFDLKQAGVFLSETLTSGQQENVIAGGNETQGMEFEAVATPIDAIHLVAGYSYNFKTINEATVGTPLLLDSTPISKFTFFGKYQLTKPFSVNFSVLYYGKMTGQSGAIYVPGQWRFDAGAQYQLTKTLMVQFNIVNIADKEFVTSLVNPESNGISPYRNWKITLRRIW